MRTAVFTLSKRRMELSCCWRPTPKEDAVKGEFTLSPQTNRRKPDGRIWVHPVIADGKLYLRDQEIIYCYDIEAK